jgi:hypothetical protein
MPDSGPSRPAVTGRVRPPAITIAAKLRRDTSGHETAANSTRVPTAFPQGQRVDPNLVSLRVLRLAGKWSGRWESNPHGRRFRVFKTSGLVRMLMPSVISV